MPSQYRGAYRDHLPLESADAPGGVLVYYADGDEEIIHVNQYIVDLFECDDVDDFLDYVRGSFKGFVHADDIGVAEDSIEGQVESQQGFDHIYYRIRTKQGHLKTINDYGRLVRTSDGRPVFFVFVVEITPAGAIDWLTGLPNMTRFGHLARLDADAIFRRGDRPVVLAFDLMGMKTFNARYGRRMGDDALRTFAEVIRVQFGGEGCSRFAEDHFYAIAPLTGIEEKVRAIFNDFRACGSFGLMPVRAGLYVCEEEDDIVEDGCERAKVACDLDRRTWRSHLCWFTDDMRAGVQLRLHVLESLDEALEKGWVRPHYQAIVRTSTSRVCAEEALARWIDPGYGRLVPDQFIPVLEDAGLSHKLDLYMVDCVVADLLKKRDAGMPLIPVSVNFSLRDLSQIVVAQEIAQRMDAVGLAHDLIRVELTESASVEDTAILKSQVDRLHAAGFQVWMDDFGSGYSSLTVLQELDFDLIKLDMALVNAHNELRSRVTVDAVVQAAAKMGVATLAEGVEHEEQAIFLESIGCDMVQGWYYARPQSIEEIIGYAKEAEADHWEELDEIGYWNAVSMVGLDQFSTHGSIERVEDVGVSDFPAGILELREGGWRILRGNGSFREFLSRLGLLDATCSTLKVNPISAPMDDEFEAAISRCIESGGWERVSGRLEYGSSYQFFVRHVSCTAEAEAFMVAGLPTMLGSALGLYGDVPVAYAVMRITLSEDGSEVADAEYVYANDMYCNERGIELHDFIGKSFRKLHRGVCSIWFPYFYRAVALGETSHDVVYDSELDHWASFYVKPSPIAGYCTYAFAVADDERREREEIVISRDTSALIIAITDALSGELSFDVAVTQLLETMARILHPDRMYLYERGEGASQEVYEWYASGTRRGRGDRLDSSPERIAAWDAMVGVNGIIFIRDVETLAKTDRPLYEQLKAGGVRCMMAVPLYNDGQLMGYCGADNYVLDEKIDYERLMRTVASFLGARIANRRLMAGIEWTYLHDNLTGILNRRGVDRAIATRLASRGRQPFSIALMDMDEFKRFNDNYGHDAGDEALRTIAAAVQDAFPSNAIIGRNGGDEFLVMLSGNDALDTDELMQAFSRRKLSCTWDGNTYDISMSIGYVVVPRDANDLRDAYTKADAALYAVKVGGKASCRRYSSELVMQYRSQVGFQPQDIAESIPGAIVVHRPGDDEILFANGEMLKLFGCNDLLDFMRLTGGTYAGVVHPDDRVRVRTELEEAGDVAVQGLSRLVNFRILTKDGNVRSVINVGRHTVVEGVGEVFYELLIASDE